MEDYSQMLFSIAFVAYVLAFMSYVGILISDKHFLKIAANTITVFGFGSQASGLLLRWFIGGLGHPPLTNLYESLQLFIWGMVLIQLFIIRKYKVHMVGIFVMIIVILGMGLASLNPNKDIEPLVPALQSYWLHLHVFLASISYGLLLASAVFALLYIIKVQRIRPVINLIFDGFSLFCLIVATASSALIFSPLSFNKMELVNGKMHTTKEIVQLFGVHYLVVILCILFFVTFYFQILDALNKKELPSVMSKKFSLVCFIIYMAIIFWLACAFLTVDGIYPASDPYKLGLLGLGFFASLIQRLIFFRYQRLIDILPTGEMLDQLSYKSILVAMPLLTLVIVTGSVWAHYAWGRFWGWDPKETWSFITWLIYNLYLHLRLQKGWQGQKISFISLIGFMAVVFTYLGVNIFLSGLHSYN